MKTIFIGTITGLFTLLTIFGGWAFSSVTEDVKAIKAELPIAKEKAVKAEVKVEGIDQRLERMEDKLDNVIEHVINDHRRTDNRTP
jgi:hypothetical protein